MRDIALGLQRAGLDEFAKRLNAAQMTEWRELGLYDDDVDGWGQAFEQAMTRTLDAGGAVHFDLTGLDIREALSGDSTIWVGRYTAWELQQIRANPGWFSRTPFYLDGVAVTGEDLSNHGIICQ